MRWSSSGFIVLSLAAEIRRNAGSFMTREIFEYNLSQLQTAFPSVADVIKKRFDNIQLTQILRNLLDERISIRNLLSILEGLLAINSTVNVDQREHIVFLPRHTNLYIVREEKNLKELDNIDYSEFLRTSMKGYISHKYSGDSKLLYAYLLHPMIEDRIHNIHKQPLQNEDYDKLMKAIYDKIKNWSIENRNPIILTNPEIRVSLRSLTEKEFPELSILSYNELLPDLNIQVLDCIS
jgi:type III secretion protein V